MLCASATTASLYNSKVVPPLYIGGNAMTTPEVLVTAPTLVHQALDNQSLDNQLLDDHEQRYYNERGKHMPSRLRALVQMRLMAALLRFADRYDILPELSLELMGNRLMPDICVMPKSPVDWSKDSIRVTEPPLLAIEIVSPKQPLSDVIDKKEEYFCTVACCSAVTGSRRLCAQRHPKNCYFWHHY